MGLIPTLPPEAKQALATVFTMSADISAIRNLLERLVELEEAKGVHGHARRDLKSRRNFMGEHEI